MSWLETFRLKKSPLKLPCERCGAKGYQKKWPPEHPM